MKTKVALFIALLLALAIGAVHAGQFTDSMSSFSLQIPSGWQSQKTSDLGSFVGPKGIAQVNISKETVEGVTLAQFAQAFPSLMAKELTGFKIASTLKGKIGTLPAAAWVYTAKVQGVTLKFKNYIAFKGSTMYNVVFCTIPERFGSDVVGFDSMIKTWSWLEK